MQVSSENLTGVGYANRYSWALFSGQKFHHHGNDPNECESTPFFMPSAEHMPIALALQEWWTKLASVREEELKKGQIVDPNISARYLRRREHRLICDVTPDVYPSGYFDCTVQVRPSSTS